MSVSAEARGGFRRLEAPGLDQFAEAAEVCYTRWDYMRELDGEARFEAFRNLNVELVVLLNGEGVMQCVGYLLPASIEIAGETLSWHYMFQVASRPEAAGAGALLVRQVMRWYPAIFGMGITPDAERLYKAFRWQPYEGFWRGVHPLNVPRLLKDFGGRIVNPRLRRLLEASAGLFDSFGASVDTICSLGTRSTPWKPREGKGAVVATYLNMYSCGEVRAADVGGTGRLLSAAGAGTLRQHAAIWRTLRKRGARLCEVLLSSDTDRRRAWQTGYIPIPLQVWCWDREGILARAIPALRARGFTFLDTDKVL